MGVPCLVDQRDIGEEVHQEGKSPGMVEFPPPFDSIEAQLR